MRKIQSKTLNVPLRSFMLFGAVLLLGTLAGTFYAVLAETDKLAVLKNTVEFSTSHADVRFFDNISKMWSKAAIYAVYIIAVILFSQNIKTVPAIFALVFAKGISMGAATAAVTRILGFKGLCAGFLSTAPRNFVFIPFFIIISVLGVRNAVGLKKIQQNRERVRSIRKRSVLILGCGAAVSLFCGLSDATVGFFAANAVLS